MPEQTPLQNISMVLDAGRGMLNNAALLLSLGVVYFFLPAGSVAGSTRRRIGSGIVVGILGIGLMLTRWELLPGLFFDTRSVLLAVAGLFLGPLPTAVAVTMTGAFRIWQGGVGTLTGVLVIVSSAGIGLLWKRYLPHRTGWWDLYLLGMAVHVAMLLAMLAMPWPMGLETLQHISLPVLGIYPLATMLLGRLLTAQRRRRDADDEARHQARRLQGMLGKAWGIVHMVDREGRSRYVSGSVTPIMGYAPEEILGQPFEALIHPQDLEAARAAFQEVVSRPGSTRALELRLRHQDGHWVWFENVATNLLQDPDVEAVVVNSLDITERRKTEAEIRGWQDRLQEVIRHDPMGVALLDRDLHFLFVSDRFCSDYRVRREEAVGRHHYEVFPNLPEKWRRAHQRALGGEVIGGRDDTFRREDGAVESARWQVRPWYEEEDVVGGIILYTEITTEQRKTEEAYGAVLQSSLEGFWVVDTRGTILDANDTACRWLGYRKEEMVGMPISRIDVQENPENVRNHIQRVVEGGGDRFEAVHRRKDGSLMDVEISITHLNVEGGRLFVFVRDITEERRAWEALERERDRLAHVIEATAVGTWEWRVGTEETVYNRRWAEMLGYTLEEIEPGTVDTWESRLHPEDRPRVRARLQAHLDEKTSRFEVEYRMRHKDGRWIWIQDRGRIREWGPDGEPLRMFGTHSDITERKEAEKALAQERALLRKVMETSPVGIVVLGSQGEILFANAFSEDLLGLHESGIDGRADNALEWVISSLDGGPFPEEDLPFRRVMDSGAAVFDIRHAISRPDGSRVFLSINAAPLRGGEGEITGVVAAMEDITQRLADQKKREQVEAQLHQAQKMEAVGRLAGGVAHDFNNMLAVIMSAAEMAIPEVDPESTVFQDLMEINEAAERSAGLTRQLLAFSRKQVIRPRAVDLNQLIEEQGKILRRLIGEEIEIHLRLREELWFVLIDPSQVDQLLANLLVNARDAIDGPGSVTIETDNVILDETHSRKDMDVGPGEYVLLSVTDTGSGMDPETLDRVFEPFFTTKEEGRGTGLGLATVYGIVRQNHGVVHVYSEPGMGSTFKVYLPRHGGESVDVKPEMEKSLTGSETILVVEDEEAILALARRFLEDSGYRVLTAGTPMEALETAREFDGKIHLLLTDVVMPGMNGKQLDNHLRELRSGIRTLFMSGYTADVIARRGILEEGVEFIEKPFNMRTLTWRVREILDAPPA